MEKFLHKSKGKKKSWPSFSCLESVLIQNCVAIFVTDVAHSLSFGGPHLYVGGFAIHLFLSYD